MKWFSGNFMMRIVTCLICGGDNIPFGQTCVNVSFETPRRTCEHCNGTHTEKHSEFVCSLACFQKYCERKAHALPRNGKISEVAGQKE